MKKQFNSEKYNATFPTRLRQLISEKKTTIKAVADEIGLTRQAVSQYQDGSTQPNVDNIAKIANYFAVSSDWLLGISGSRSQNLEYDDIQKKIGLSDDALDLLYTATEMAKKTDADGKYQLVVDTANMILGSSEFSYFSRQLNNYIAAYTQDNTSFESASNAFLADMAIPKNSSYEIVSGTERIALHETILVNALREWLHRVGESEKTNGYDKPTNPTPDRKE